MSRLSLLLAVLLAGSMALLMPGSQPAGREDSAAVAATQAPTAVTAAGVVSTPGGQAAPCGFRPSEVMAGDNMFDSMAQVTVDFGGGPGVADMAGPTQVRRGPPGDADGDHNVQIDVEIVSMQLTGGGLNLTQSPSRPSMGMVESQSGDTYPADSFFDVFFEVQTGMATYHNGQPMRMQATIPGDPRTPTCLPPFDTAYQSTGPVPLLDNTGKQVGTVVRALHTPRPRTITVIKLDEQLQPRPGALVTLHPRSDGNCSASPVDGGVTGSNGIADLGPMSPAAWEVKEATPPAGLNADPSNCQVLDHTGPYLNVIVSGTVLNGGADGFPSCGYLELNITGVGTDRLYLNGPTIIQRSPFSGPPNNVIDTEIVSMTLQGASPIIGPVQVTQSTNPARRSRGQVQNVVMSGGTFVSGDSFFDVFVDVQTGIGTLHNEQPVRMQANGITAIPPINRFYRPPAPVSVPILNATGQVVGFLTHAIHVPLPPGEKCIVYRNPPAPPERMSFSIERGGPSDGAFHPADILNPGPVVARACPTLGLTAPGCATSPSPRDDIRALSYGFDFTGSNPALPKKVFSVDTGSLGLAGTAVDGEVSPPGCAPDEPQADLFATMLTGTNGPQEFDGNGVPCGTNAGFPLGLIEPSPSDDTDAEGELPTGDPVYFTLAALSPSLTGLAGGPYSTAHLFKSVAGVVSVYATPAELGLSPDDKIDGLCLRDKDGKFDANGDGLFDDPPDRLQFSVDASSPFLSVSPPLTPPRSAADQFKPKTTVAGLPVRVNTAADHGLLVADNLDAMKCPLADADGDHVADPIDTGVGTFGDGTITGSLSGNVCANPGPISIMVAGCAGGTGGSAMATCPATMTSDSSTAQWSYIGVEAVAASCGGSIVLTASVGPVTFMFGPFTATLPMGSTVVIDDLPSNAAVCGGSSAPGAYQIAHTAGSMPVTVSSAVMSPPVSIFPGGTYRDCDADAIFGAPGPDNCPSVANPDQANIDTDALGNACDPDDDNDLVLDVDEGPCGSDPLDVTPPLSRPERIDPPFTGVDDDGDSLIDEALPAGSESFDCDGDGYKRSVEDHVYQYIPQTTGDQKTCAEYEPSPILGRSPSRRWPADFVSGGFPDSTERITLTDILSFVAPSPKILGTNPGDTAYRVRWDLVPGPGPFSTHINISDLLSLIAGPSGFPPMFGGAKAFASPAPECPW